MKAPEDTLTIGEAALELDRTCRHIRRLIAQGRLHPERVSSEPGLVHFKIARSKIERHCRHLTRHLRRLGQCSGMSPRLIPPRHRGAEQVGC